MLLQHDKFTRLFTDHHIVCFFRGHPKVRNMDMMHASDYSNMSLEQMDKKMQENKKKDKQYAKGLE